MEDLTTATLFAALVLGFALGLRHATDADHVVAVSTIVGQSSNIFRSALIGAFWGIGHTTTLFIMGILVIIFRVSIPERMALFLEFLVGIMLVFLGWLVLRDQVRRAGAYLARRLHVHEHLHNAEGEHIHFHDPEEAHRAAPAARTPGRAIVIGMVHGLAGSAALMLLVLTTIPSPLAGLVYILIFGVGSIAGMLLLSGVIGLPFALTAQYSQTLNEGIRIVAGTVSIVLGLLVMYEIGVVEGLFL